MRGGLAQRVRCAPRGAERTRQPSASSLPPSCPFPIAARRRHHQILLFNLSRNNIVALPRELGSLKLMRCVPLDLVLVVLVVQSLRRPRQRLSHPLRHLASLDAVQLLACVRSELDLSHNRLEYLPREIGLCTRLRKLRVSHNRLLALPTELTTLRLLEELDASHNAITEFPKELCLQPALRVLSLANNRIRQLPVEFADLPVLEDVDVSGNEELVSIPPSLRLNAPIVKWLCALRRTHAEDLVRVQAVNDELEVLVRNYDLERVALREEISRLRAERREILAQMPRTYLAVKHSAASCCVLM